MDRAMRSWLCGLGVGAGAALLLDPDRGARRRALIRDKAVRAQRKTRDAVDATARDLSNRVSGAIAEARAMFGNDTANDHVLCERVRAHLGRVASHPRAIYVFARDGRVVLSGDVLLSEVPTIVSSVRRVRGVDEVENHMTAHDSPDAVPSLQGESERPGRWSTWMREGWSPTAMLIAGASAAAFAVASAARR
jgi:BON domain